MIQHQHSPRDSMGDYHLRYEVTDGDGRFFGVKARLRYLFRQRPAKQGRDDV